MIQILGILDIISAIVLVLRYFFESLPDKIVWIFAIYLIVKGALFLLGRDFASIIDIFCGIILVFAVFIPISYGFMIFTAVFLIQKGIFSLIS
ncbi:hypothetical protein FJZ17_03550 [Candidatus Pacearchaeota archaeon]|nr:hypothetical protein [Candidatus Pacearchaeota archaeon]